MVEGQSATDPAGALHHLELGVPDLRAAVTSWGWLLEFLGYRLYQERCQGRSWKLGSTYIVLQASSALVVDLPSDRRRPGLNHLAFHAPSHVAVDAIVNESLQRGWSLLFPERRSFAGGPDHYAAYLEDENGFEVEVVAPEPIAEGG
jgi:catechol 2,3-dioxygenase-like lactoylglutathione lyase family enzyme